MPAFENLADYVGTPAFQEWLQVVTPELSVLTVWSEEKAKTPVVVAMHKLLVIQVSTGAPGTHLRKSDWGGR